MTLPRELQDTMARIFADACVERVANTSAARAKLSPAAAMLCMRAEYAGLLDAIDLAEGEERETLFSQIRSYRGMNAADLYESIAFCAYTSGFKMPMDKRPTADEYIQSFARIMQR